MPTKNISLGPGTLYIQTPGGMEPFCGISEGTLEAEETERPKENPYILAADLAKGSDFTAEVQLSPAVAKSLTAMGKACGQAAEALVRFCRAYIAFAAELCSLGEFEKQREAAVIKCAPPRVRHLAQHGKKYRTRKKNINRAWREYQRRSRKRDRTRANTK